MGICLSYSTTVLYVRRNRTFIYLFIYFLLATLVICTRCRKKHYQIRREKQLEAAVVVSFLTIWISNFTLLQKKKKTTISVKKWNIYVSQSNTTEGHFLRELCFGLVKSRLVFLNGNNVNFCDFYWASRHTTFVCLFE